MPAGCTADAAGAGQGKARRAEACEPFPQKRPSNVASEHMVAATVAGSAASGAG